MSRRASARLKYSSANSPRTKRNHRQVSYKEPESDEEYQQDFDDEPVPRREVPQKVKTLPRRYPSRHLSQVPKQMRTTPSKPKQRRQPRLRSSNSSVSQMSDYGPEHSGFTGCVSQAVLSSSKYDLELQSTIPWNTLEYDILLNIFIYASKMMDHDRKQSSNWLIGTATICSAFQEPALTALYQSPPLGTVDSVRGFLEFFNSGSPSAVQYGNKVKILAIEAIPALTRKEKSHDAVSLESILAVTPNIRSLAVELYSDDPSFKRNVVNFTSRGRANVYRPAMMEVMDQNNTFLRSMKWNYFFNLDQEWPWSVLGEIHQHRSMQNVQHLDIVWLNGFTKVVNKARQIDSLISGIRALKHLKSLTLTLCELYHNEKTLLDGLPRNLEKLCIIDCDDLTSEMLAGFLITHGHDLRQLIVNHNRSLSLGFMGILATACPHLEVLKVDLSCYGLMLTSTDSEPSFQYLLPEGITPTWPSSLQFIEMAYLRKWERNAATTFFQSLVDSAQVLSYLRHLVIKTTVDLDWRDRVAFRDEWSARLIRVFKRISTPPRVYNGQSKKTNGHIIRSVGKATNGNLTIKPGDEPIASRLKRNRRSDTEDESMNSSATTPDPTARPVRSRKLDQLVAEASTTNEAGLYIQGQCNVVDIRIENLRPMETQYAERDFMDDEISGDEDWDGRDHYDSYVGGTYAW